MKTQDQPEGQPMKEGADKTYFVRFMTSNRGRINKWGVFHEQDRNLSGTPIAICTTPENAKMVVKALLATPSAGRVEELEGELADALENSCRQGCHTGKVDEDYNGQVAGTLVTDSGALSTYAEQLRRLAQLKRFRIVTEFGRMVVGYWPENDPAPSQPAHPGANK